MAVGHGSTPSQSGVPPGMPSLSLWKCHTTARLWSSATLVALCGDRTLRSSEQNQLLWAPCQVGNCLSGLTAAPLLGALGVKRLYKTRAHCPVLVVANPLPALAEARIQATGPGLWKLVSAIRAAANVRFQYKVRMSVPTLQLQFEGNLLFHTSTKNTRGSMCKRTGIQERPPSTVLRGGWAARLHRRIQVPFVAVRVVRVVAVALSA